MTTRERNREAARLSAVADKLDERATRLEQQAQKARGEHVAAVKAWNDYVLSAGPRRPVMAEPSEQE